VNSFSSLRTPSQLRSVAYLVYTSFRNPMSSHPPNCLPLFFSFLMQVEVKLAPITAGQPSTGFPLPLSCVRPFKYFWSFAKRHCPTSCFAVFSSSPLAVFILLPDRSPRPFFFPRTLFLYLSLLVVFSQTHPFVTPPSPLNPCAALPRN